MRGFAQDAEIAEGIFFYLAGRRQPGKNTSLRQNNWGFPAARPVVFTESVFTLLNAKPIYLGSPDSEKEKQLSVLSVSAVKIIQAKNSDSSVNSVREKDPFRG